MLRKLSNKHFWLLSAIVFLILTFFSYGFIRNLSFWRDDYGDIYHCYAGGNISWPYHGVKFLICPFYLLFKNQPAGYFKVALIFYALLSLVIALFVWKITKNRQVAFFSGLIFCSGYVGSEAMFWVEHAINMTVYLILVFSLLSFYKTYLESYSLKYWLFAFSLYSIAVLFLTQRAHYLILIVFLTDWYLSKRVGKSLISDFLAKFRRLFPFAMSFLGAYMGFPFLLGKGINSSTGILLGTEKFSAVANMSLLSDLGNYLVPSAFQEVIVEAFAQKNYFSTVFLLTLVFLIFLGLLLFSLKTFLSKKIKLIYLYLATFLLLAFLLATFTNENLGLFLGSLIGTFLIYLLWAFIFLFNIDKSSKKTIFFLLLCWIASYLIFHLREYPWVHPS